MTSILFWSATTLYALAAALFFFWFAFRGERASKWGLATSAVALAPHAASLALRWVEVGHGPYQTRYEVLSADAFLLVVTWLLACALARGVRSLGVLVAPGVLLLMGFAADTFGLKEEVSIIFKSWWLVLHIGFAKLFTATTLLAAACAGVFLLGGRRPGLLARLPPPEKLDLYAHQFLLVSFLFLGVMIAAGSLWAHQSWGRYWGWDPIETSALVTWIAYGVILHFRVLHRWSGARMAWLTLGAMVLCVMTMFLVATIVPTIHNMYMVTQ